MTQQQPVAQGLALPTHSPGLPVYFIISLKYHLSVLGPTQSGTGLFTAVTNQLHQNKSWLWFSFYATTRSYTSQSTMQFLHKPQHDNLLTFIKRRVIWTK